MPYLNISEFISLIRDLTFNLLHNNNLMLGLMFFAISVVLIIVSLSIDKILRKIVLGFISRWMSETRFNIVNALVESKIFNVMIYYSFVLVFLFGSTLVAAENKLSDFYSSFFTHLAILIAFVVTTFTISKAIDAGHIYYEKLGRDFTIFGYIKMAKFVLWCIMIILYIAYILNRSPWSILTAIGAVSAFFLLIFRDTFLGLVSSIQATANQIVKLGDWVTISKHNIDGVVTNISISTIKVLNWDNTISTIPTFALTNETVQNWQHVFESNARRIYRHINIDIDTIKPLNEGLIAELTNKYPVIGKLIEKDPDLVANSNLTLFRAFLIHCLYTNPFICKDKTCLVRHLQPTQAGLPLQIYAFTSHAGFIHFETFQSEMFEYIFMVIADFELKILQIKAVENS